MSQNLTNDKCFKKQNSLFIIVFTIIHHKNKLLLKKIKPSMDWNLVWIFVFEYFVRTVFFIFQYASFIVLDIERFYPSVSLEFFHKAINFVKTIRDIPEKDFPLLCNLHESCYSITRNFVWKNLVMKSLMSNGMFWWCWSLWVSLCLHSAFVKDALQVFDDFEQKSAWSNIFWNVKVCVFRKCIQ